MLRTVRYLYAPIYMVFLLFSGVVKVLPAVSDTFVGKVGKPQPCFSSQPGTKNTGLLTYGKDVQCII